MNAQPNMVFAQSLEEFSDPYTQLAPRPRTVADTGLSESFLINLIAKHLYAGGVLELNDLSKRSALSGAIVEELLDSMRNDAWVETRRSNAQTGAIRYALTDRGRNNALDALAVSGYSGPAPVPLDFYRKIVAEQSVHKCIVTRDRIEQAFDGVVIEPELLDQLGPAMHSGKAIFMYGAPGTGKTFISRRLARLLGDDVLIPHAISAGDTVIQLFDPLLHEPIDYKAKGQSLLLEQGHDPRFVLCKRPSLSVGGELTLDELEVRHDAATKEYHAPLQLKATNGMFLIDDLGRQRVPTPALLNRWIVPLEERKDFFNLGSGKHIDVTFDVVLLFSTNLNPNDLADGAFLRRIGHKIRFNDLKPEAYRQIWQQVCTDKALEYKPEVVDFVLERLHKERDVALRPCHPRDLIGLAHDRSLYEGEKDGITTDRLGWAWDNYFIRM